MEASTEVSVEGATMATTSTEASVEAATMEASAEGWTGPFPAEVVDV